MNIVTHVRLLQMKTEVFAMRIQHYNHGQSRQSPPPPKKIQTKKQTNTEIYPTAEKNSINIYYYGFVDVLETITE